MTEEKCCLLIGNTRWHWAIQKNGLWRFFHTAPNTKKLKAVMHKLWKWAAVGPIPKDIHLDPSKCIKISDVPILKLPTWVGIDRALVGWQAYTIAKTKNLHNQGILIADAGTVLSITHITANGEFGGGQLIAGLQLQLTAMSRGTKNLNPVQHKSIPKTLFPISTEDAMLKGSFESLLSTIKETQSTTKMPLWLCGGDSTLIYDQLKNSNKNVFNAPDLGLEALIKMNLPLN